MGVERESGVKLKPRSGTDNYWIEEQLTEGIRSRYPQVGEASGEGRACPGIFLMRIS
jgi:hypothetical protein